MNKAKGIFAAGIIVIVAGASVALWHLNDRGLIGNDSTTIYVDEDENIENNNDQNNENRQDNVNEDHEQKTENTDIIDDDKTDVSETEINAFLTTFSKVYFAEQGKTFDINKRSDYELILFAFSHIRCTDKALITLEQRDDGIVYYNGISVEKVNEVLNKHFDVSVPEQSVYTENSYAFFSCSDGYFYTPAADGLSYMNTAVATSVEQEGDHIITQFDIYSGEEHYADGEAKIQLKNGEMKLIYYHIAK